LLDFGELLATIQSTATFTHQIRVGKNSTLKPSNLSTSPLELSFSRCDEVNIAISLPGFFKRVFLPFYRFSREVC
jgi:hypothetical protein